MNCSEIRQYIDVYVDGEFDSSEVREFESHLDGCQPCLRAVDSEREFRSVLKQKLPPIAAPDHLRRAIVAQLAGVEPAREKTTARWVAWAAPLAAAAALGLMIYTGGFGDAANGQLGTSATVAAGTSAKAAVPAARGATVRVGTQSGPTAAKPGASRVAFDRVAFDGGDEIRGREIDVRTFMQGRVPFPVEAPMPEGDGVLVEGARKVMDGGSEGILWTYRVNGEQVVVIQAAATTRDAMRPDLKIERQGSV
ncbi:MAG: mycothiol system anti-sigma-R factor, partial [Myxococcota bacterium]